VLSTSGEKIGGIGQIYLDDSTSEPTFVTVKTGLFGTSQSFVPLDNATVNGGDIRVGYDKDTVKDAPRVDPDGDITPEEEERLYAYYSGTGTGDNTGTGTTTSGYTDSDAVDDRNTGYSGERDTVGHDTSGPTTDDAMTRSEEQLRVGTEKREAGRARLRKYVTTENVTQTVPVSREEVRIEREPITDANRGNAMSGPAISEEEHEVVLHEETPVVEKEAVPVERVRLDKETVTDETTVSEEVRKEQIDTDGPGNAPRR
jgi:uncharacterized protein (TIGR02271 family)